jgi:uncharacterized protein YpmB
MGYALTIKGSFGLFAQRRTVAKRSSVAKPTAFQLAVNNNRDCWKVNCSSKKKQSYVKTNCHCMGVTTDGFWIDDRIYWTL